MLNFFQTNNLRDLLYRPFYFLIPLLLWTFLAIAKPPELTPKDTRLKLQEILKAHVCHQQLTEELVRRSILNYLEELDPAKTYFLEGEIKEWLEPSQTLLHQTLENYHREHFTLFEHIYNQMLVAIQRRNAIEQQLEGAPLPTAVHSSEFKELSWAKSEEELQTRLLRIRALQLQTAEKIHPKTQEVFLQRIQKRRLHRENELKTSSKELILSYVLKATSASLDSQTMYFTPSEANQFMIQVQQKLCGIGAQLRDDLNGLTIMRLIEGGPASVSNKLKIGDRIIAVDQEPIIGLDISEAVDLIRGPQGSIVQLTILRETKEGESLKEESFPIEIVRGEIVLKEMRLETTYEPYGDGVIATIHLFSFYQDEHSSSAADLASAIETLKKEHRVKGIILDVRNNPGGLLPQAVAVTGLFISKGIVVSIKDNTGQIQHLRAVDTQKVWDGPLIVLTGRSSASASEIVAQTLQDYGRALVIGDPETFGKGTFQTFTLESTQFAKINPKGEYKVTRGCYYTVSGKSPQLTGVKADIVVPGLFSEMPIGEKYAKFPIDNDQIAPHFQDNLSDIPAIHRHQFKKIYQENLQPVLALYQPYIEQLKKNSSARITQNKNYQNFLKTLANPDDLAESVDFFGQNDLQHIETTNIMKDLILLLEKAS